MRVHIWPVAITILLSGPPSWAEFPDSVIYKRGESLSREQVRAELEYARTHGLIPQGDGDYPIMQPASQTKTRAEVLQELQRAREEGLLDFTDDEYPVTETIR